MSDFEKLQTIYAKESWTNDDIAFMHSISISCASQLAKRIKRKVGDRLGIEGRLYKHDYLDYMGVAEKDLFMSGFDKLAEDSAPPVVRKTVCYDTGERK